MSLKRSEAELLSQRVQDSKKDIERLKAELAQLVQRGLNTNSKGNSDTKTSTSFHPPNIEDFKHTKSKENSVKSPKRLKTEKSPMRNKPESKSPTKTSKTQNLKPDSKNNENFLTELKRKSNFQPELKLETKNTVLTEIKTQSVSNKLPGKSQNIKDNFVDLTNTLEGNGEKVEKKRSYDVDEAREYMRKQKEKRLELLRLKKNESRNLESERKQKLLELQQKSLKIVTRNRERSKSREKKLEAQSKQVSPKFEVQSKQVSPKFEVQSKQISPRFELQTKHQFSPKSETQTKSQFSSKSESKSQFSDTQTSYNFPPPRRLPIPEKLIKDQITIRSSSEDPYIKLKKAKAATKIQSYYKGYLQRKRFRESLSIRRELESQAQRLVEKESRKNEIDENLVEIVKSLKKHNSKEKLEETEVKKKKKLPDWLETGSHSPSYNFISTVKRKLNLATGNHQKSKTDVGVQSEDFRSPNQTAQEIREIIKKSLSEEKSEVEERIEEERRRRRRGDEESRKRCEGDKERKRDRLEGEEEKFRRRNDDRFSLEDDVKQGGIVDGRKARNRSRKEDKCSKSVEDMSKVEERRVLDYSGRNSSSFRGNDQSGLENKTSRSLEDILRESNEVILSIDEALRRRNLEESRSFEERNSRLSEDSRNRSCDEKLKSVTVRDRRSLEESLNSFLQEKSFEGTSRKKSSLEGSSGTSFKEIFFERDEEKEVDEKRNLGKENAARKLSESKSKSIKGVSKSIKTDSNSYKDEIFFERDEEKEVDEKRNLGKENAARKLSESKSKSIKGFCKSIKTDSNSYKDESKNLNLDLKQIDCLKLKSKSDLTDSDTSRNIPDISSEDLKTSNPTYSKPKEDEVFKKPLNLPKKIKKKTVKEVADEDYKLEIDLKKIQNLRLRRADRVVENTMDFGRDEDKLKELPLGLEEKKIEETGGKLPEVDCLSRRSSIISYNKCNYSYKSSLDNEDSVDAKELYSFRKYMEDFDASGKIQYDFPKRKIGSVKALVPPAVSLRGDSDKENLLKKIDGKVGNLDGKVGKPVEVFLKDGQKNYGENMGNSNQIHVKVEAELHLLNDFYESMEQFIAVEKSLLDLRNKSNTTIFRETRDTQTSIFEQLENSTTENSSRISNRLNENKTPSNTENNLESSINNLDSTKDNLDSSNMNSARENLDSSKDNPDSSISTEKNPDSSISTQKNLDLISQHSSIRKSSIKDFVTSAKNIAKMGQDSKSMVSLNLDNTLASALEISELNDTLDETKEETADLDNTQMIVERNSGNLQAGISLGMFEQLIRDEEARIKNLKTILKIREKALLDRTKGELAWLEIQKKHLLETGKPDEASAVKKKQRGIILKLQHEKQEMQKLKQMQKAASKERKTILKEQRNMIKAQLSTFSGSLAKIRRTPSKDRRKSGPVKVYQTTETSLSRKSSVGEEIIYASRSESVISRITETGSVESDKSLVRETVRCNRTENAKRSLLMREAALQKRRREAEKLLQWHQKLLEEEKKITELEMAASNIINQVPSVTVENSKSKDKYTFKGSQLNVLWENMTGLTDKKFEDTETYNLSQVALERFCKDARKISNKDRGKSKDEEKNVEEQPDLEQGIKQSESALNEIMQNISNITDEISELYKLNSVKKLQKTEEFLPKVPDSIHKDSIKTTEIGKKKINKKLFEERSEEIDTSSLVEDIVSDESPEESNKTEVQRSFSEEGVKTEESSNSFISENLQGIISKSEVQIESEVQSEIISVKKSETVEDVKSESIKSSVESEIVKDTTLGKSEEDKIKSDILKISSSQSVEEEVVNKSREVSELIEQSEVEIGVESVKSLKVNSQGLDEKSEKLGILEVSDNLKSDLDEKLSADEDKTMVEELLDEDKIEELVEEKSVQDSDGFIVKSSEFNENRLAEESSEIFEKSKISETESKKSEEILKTNSKLEIELDKSEISQQVEIVESIETSKKDLSKIETEISQEGEAETAKSIVASRDEVESEISRQGEVEIAKSIETSRKEDLSKIETEISQQDEVEFVKSIETSRKTEISQEGEVEIDKSIETSKKEGSFKSEISQQGEVEISKSIETSKEEDRTKIETESVKIFTSESLINNLKSGEDVEEKFDIDKSESEERTLGEATEEEIVNLLESKDVRLNLQDKSNNFEVESDNSDSPSEDHLKIPSLRLETTSLDVSENLDQSEKEENVELVKEDYKQQRLESEDSVKFDIEVKKSEEVNSIIECSEDRTSSEEQVLSEDDSSKITDHLGERSIESYFAVNKEKIEANVSEEVSLDKNEVGLSEESRVSEDLETEESENFKVIDVSIKLNKIESISEDNQKSLNLDESQSVDKGLSLVESQSIEKDLSVDESVESEKSQNDSDSKIDVKKIVSEILDGDGFVETKSQELHVTPSGINLSETSPELGSPVEKDSKVLKDIGSEAEELLRKQLAIDQEIKELKLQQQQANKEYYIYLREIPNKPPPPYKPPVQTQSPIGIIPTSFNQIQPLIETLAKMFYKAHKDNNLYTIKFPEVISISNINKPCQEFIFDLCKEKAIEHYKQFEELSKVSWMKLEKHSFKKQLNAEGLKEYLGKKLKEVLFGDCLESKQNMIIKWSQKKCDNVDRLLILESAAEEAEWINYDKDELVVKNEVTNDIMNMLLQETAEFFASMASRRKVKHVC